MTVEIRPARSAGDLETIRRLLRAYEAETGLDLCFQGFAAELDALPGDYAPPAGRLLCAESEGRLVGCIALRPLEGGRCEMKRLYVLPEYRGERVGQALVGEILAQARQAGYGSMYLDTAPGMEKAQALYERFGFRDVPPYTWNPIPGVRFMAVQLAEGDRSKQESVDRAPLHVGIVACSSEGAALCYRTLCAEGARLLGPHAHPEVSVHTHSLAKYLECLDRGDLAGVAALMLASAGKLASIGADFLVCPDNTIHQAFALVEAQSPRPWLHIAEVVAAEAAGRGFRRLGLLGTRWLVDSAVYPDKLAARGIEWVRPSTADRDETNRIIMDELVYGVFSPEGIACFREAIERLKDQGCDAVVLGCTEIPLIIDDTNSPLPTLDSTRLLARAALARAVHRRGLESTPTAS